MSAKQSENVRFKLRAAWNSTRWGIMRSAVTLVGHSVLFVCHALKPIFWRVNQGSVFFLGQRQARRLPIDQNLIDSVDLQNGALSEYARNRLDSGGE